MNKNNFFICVLSILVLSGCKSSHIDEVKEEIQYAKETAIAIPPEIPKLKKQEIYVYTSMGTKSPFRNTITEITKSKKTFTDVQPDLERTKGELEQYNIESFIMMGTIKKQTEKNQEAILMASNGKIYSVNIGDYLGKNNGQIKKITSKKIEIEEIIQNGAYRWVKRPTMISMNSD